MFISRSRSLRRVLYSFNETNPSNPPRFAQLKSPTSRSPVPSIELARLICRAENDSGLPGLTIASIIGKITLTKRGPRAAKYHVGFQTTKIQFLQSHTEARRPLAVQCAPKVTFNPRFFNLYYPSSLRVSPN